jgi:NAD(P)-dependent dehydrogenase (short-subunit alcohol dehydrogenase family)
VIINSVTAKKPQTSMAAVSAARAAVENLSQSLAIELVQYSICVNNINLGVIATERQCQRFKESGTKESFEFWSKQEAIQRGALIPRMGTPQEVAPAVAFLLSPLSSYITRSSIDVAGGMDGISPNESFLSSHL